MNIRLAGIVPESIVDGPGYRFAIFAQGCPHNCAGCHNPHTHDFGGGKSYKTEKIVKLVSEYKLTDGVTFTGGEPFCQPEAFAALADGLQNYNIYCFTGYTFDELVTAENPAVRALLDKIDVLIDGRFIESRMNYKLKFKGSDNQRLLDCKQSLKLGKAVELIEN
ncbi:MAG: anaerobic ribonucleoside-triphosphate reductase activating protein [Oscillospiraceae bacterium]|nr:anaerobic ribonucleoside-triphosphate reductase activating protein [Oscillospiraceae bacterium]